MKNKQIKKFPKITQERQCLYLQHTETELVNKNDHTQPSGPSYEVYQTIREILIFQEVEG